jgi:hypothetical protein
VCVTLIPANDRDASAELEKLSWLSWAGESAEGGVIDSVPSVFLQDGEEDCVTGDLQTIVTFS